MSMSNSVCRSPTGMGIHFQPLKVAFRSFASTRNLRDAFLTPLVVGNNPRKICGAVVFSSVPGAARDVSRGDTVISSVSSQQAPSILLHIWSGIVKFTKLSALVLLISCVCSVPAFATALTASAPVTIKTRWQEISAILSNAMFTPQGQVVYSLLLGFMCVGLVTIAAGGMMSDRSQQAMQQEEVSDRVVASVLAQQPARSSPLWTQASGRTSMTTASVGGTLVAGAAISAATSQSSRAQAPSRSAPAPLGARGAAADPPTAQERPAESMAPEEASPELQQAPGVQTQTQGAVEELPTVLYTFEEVAPASGGVYSASTMGSAAREAAAAAAGGATGGPAGAAAGGAAAGGTARAAAAAMAPLLDIEVAPKGGSKVGGPQPPPDYPPPGSCEPPAGYSVPGSYQTPAGFRAPAQSAASVDTLSGEDIEGRKFLDGAKNPALPIMFVAALVFNTADKMKPMGDLLASSVFGTKPAGNAAVGVSSNSAPGRVLTVNARGAGSPAFPVAARQSSDLGLWALAAPIAKLVASEKRQASAAPFKVPVIRHKADPMASIRDIQVPTQRYEWDPVTHLSSISAPTDNSRYDPWVQIHRVQPPTVRHPADPLAHLSSIATPTARHGADPLSHIRNIEVPTACHGADPLAHIWKIDVDLTRYDADPFTHILNMDIPTDLHRADPLAHISSIAVPTTRHGADPLAHISRIAAPTTRHGADPLSHIGKIEVPTARHGADLLSHIGKIEVPTARHGADPLAHLASVAAPTARHGADPLAHLANITAPEGDESDPLRALLRAERSFENPAWDPVHHIAGLQAPDWRPMWDPMTSMPDMSRATSKPFWDPVSFLSSLQPTGSRSIFANLTPPTGKAWFDPLARMSSIQAPDGSSGLDMFKGVVQAALAYKSQKPKANGKPSGSNLRYPTPYSVQEGRGVTVNANVVASEKYEPGVAIVGRDDEDARALGVSISTFVGSNADSI